MSRPPAVCLLGPTATGKTDVALSLCKRFPFEIVSVDSALVYRGMDIGTAKPDAETLARVPHNLVDIRDPEHSYSAGDFVRDASEVIESIYARGRLPLLVGGTMLYFQALTGGMAELPPASEEIRDSIDADARRRGWPALRSTRRRRPASSRGIGSAFSGRWKSTSPAARQSPRYGPEAVAGATGIAFCCWHFGPRIVLGSTPESSGAWRPWLRQVSSMRCGD